MQEDYIGVLTQWLFLFGLLSVLFIPAWRFRRIALEHQRKGWLFFLVGLLVGLLIIQSFSWGLQLLARLVEVKEFPEHVFVLVLALCYVVIIIANGVFKRVISK